VHCRREIGTTYWTGEKHSSKEPLILRPELQQMPLYVRAGAIVPMQTLVQYTGEIPAGGLRLRVFPERIVTEACTKTTEHIRVSERRCVTHEIFMRRQHGIDDDIRKVEANGYKPWWASTEVTVFGAPGLPKSVEVVELKFTHWSFDEKSHAVTLTVDGEPKDWKAEISY